jgi:aminoglycoside phosphotransferase (APT) family kinase protein
MQGEAALMVTEEVVREIARRQGIKFEKWRRLESKSLINYVFSLDDDYVLRLPKDSDWLKTHQADRESLAIPAARAAGVRTPELIAYERSCDLLGGLPYLIVQRVRGVDGAASVDFESLSLDPQEAPRVWEELGRDLAKLHAGELAIADPPWATLLSSISPKEMFDLTERRERDGWISSLEARWFRRWLERLTPMVPGSVVKRLVHADMQMSNVMVVPSSLEYLALIDWGCAAKADVAVDFLSLPLAAVPLLLAGHRDLAPLDEDETAEARILWRRIGLLLGKVPNGPGPNRSWEGRPIAWLTDLLRFFQNPPRGRWQDLAPPRM